MGIDGGRGNGGSGRVLHPAAFFHVQNSLVASTGPKCIQGGLGTITGLFDRVGLWTNTGNTVGTFFYHYRAAGTHSEEAYER